MITSILSRCIILILGTLYPAYASYKAVRNKDVKDYLKWIMYWIVFAFFTCFETFTDIFLSWFPFYYELKVVIVIWLLSPVTEGSSVLYRNFVHPMLTKREKEIDEYINQAKEKGCSAVLQLGSRGMNYATTVIMQTALKGGGNLVSTLKKSYSLSDLSEPDMQRSQDEVDEIVYGRSNQMVQYRQIQPNQRYMKTRMQHPNQNYSNGINRSSSTSRSVDIYYDDRMTRSSDNYDYIRSSEDISSGYSSTVEPVSMALSRTSSLTNAPRFRTKSKRTEKPNRARGETYNLHSDRIVEVDDDKEAALEKVDDINNLNMKYELFCEWLRRNGQESMLSENHEQTASTMLTEDEVSSFATNSDDSENDVFLDTESDFPMIILSVDDNCYSNLNGAESPSLSEYRVDTPSHLSVSDFDCSSSDITVSSKISATSTTSSQLAKCKAKHKKGRAPPIPMAKPIESNCNESSLTVDLTNKMDPSEHPATLNQMPSHTRSARETDI
ncbi:uncharacterized protein LOC116345624 isoform X2 [Contarinia nasturtii]|uniref:uncharacterized protein LOC116345624 isoform X2 n=1 Tax=Contarinia nasturtii TaxID=265458 RepID=UPI0012D49480|nr:uncharacterized protein LOC116345624 isoform X2 [Contarinia nasturtii]